MRPGLRFDVVRRRHIVSATLHPCKSKHNDSIITFTLLQSYGAGDRPRRIGSLLSEISRRKKREAYDLYRRHS